MRIINLQASNFKRLGVVEISPEGHVITIGGKNGEGKSSVLDAIYVALKGRAVAPPMPIRKGEEKCTIRLDMGEIVVTRNFHAKEGGKYTDTLKVESGEGLRYSQPQDVLNALLGDIGFDPFEFVNLKPKEQAARLLEMVPLSIDLDEFAEKDASDFENRRDANREVKRLEAQLDGIPSETVPDVAPDRAALMDRLGNAADINSAIDREERRRSDMLIYANNLRNEAVQQREEAKRLRDAADAADARAKLCEDQEKAKRAEIENLPPLDEQVDTDAIRTQVREADATIAAIERQDRRKAIAAELDRERKLSQGYTDALDERKRQRNAALAEAEMPVYGLAFAVDEDGSATLTFDGLPFAKDQISTAAQLRVSTAIGMAANPRLRVLRIMDGSLLDEDSMKMLAEMAEAEDYQLWVEVVGEGGVGIVMENGSVRGADREAEQDDTADTKPEAEPRAKATDAADEGKLL